MSQAMVRFNCPQCNKQFSAQAALAGKTLSCQCGAKVPIPTAGQASPPPSRSSQPSVSAQPTVTPRPVGYGSSPSTPPQPVPQPQYQPQYQPQAFAPTGGMQQPSKFCHACGQSIDARAEICPKCGVRQPGMFPEAGAANGKNRLVAALLALLLGGIGAHHFYLGRPILGVVYLLFCWTFIPAIVALIEGLVLLCTSDEAFQRAQSNNLVSGGSSSLGSVQQKPGGNGCAVALVICVILGAVAFFMIEDHNRRRQNAIDFHRGEADRALRDAERMLDDLRRRQ